MIEQHQRTRWASLGCEVVAHHQYHVHIIRLGLVGDVTAKDHEPVEMPGGDRKVVDGAKSLSNGRALLSAGSETSQYITQQSGVKANRKIAVLVEIR